MVFWLTLNIKDTNSMESCIKMYFKRDAARANLYLSTRTETVNWLWTLFYHHTHTHTHVQGTR